MSLHVEVVRFGKENELEGTLVYPTLAKKPLSAVLVFQEAWGVDEHILDVTKRFARAGYAALAPHFFARGGKYPDAIAPARLAELKAAFDELGMKLMDPAQRDAALASKPEAARARIVETIGAMFGAVGNGDENGRVALEAAKWLRASDVSKGAKVASVGFCMGGGVSALLATIDPQLAGAVVFYGSAPAEDKIASIACPVLGLYGGEDARVNAGLPAFEAAMKRHGKTLETHVYPGAQHAFFNDTRPVYDVKASRDAFARTLAFFRDRLG